MPLCRLLSLPRAADDHGNTSDGTRAHHLIIRDHIQGIALAMPASGYLRITHE
jgi:hypothetical protein